MITKLCIVCLCMTAGTMVGLYCRKRKRRRPEYFAACTKLTDKLIGDISFRHENLFTILQTFSAENDDALQAHIRAYLAHPYADYMPDDAFLQVKERQWIGEFFRSLGNADIYTQLQELARYREQFDALQKEETEKYRQYGALALKLSILIGLAIGILLL